MVTAAFIVVMVQFHAQIVNKTKAVAENQAK
jgi:hypothetical protein